MKRKVAFTVVVVALTILLVTPHQANPIIAGWFNELTFEPSGWKIEMHAHLSGTLDGSYMASRTGQAYFKDGIPLGGEFRVISQESLLTQLTIDPLGDSLTLYSQQGNLRGRLVFGAGGEIEAPRSGCSICLRESGSWYYLDNTPTLGLQNDVLNATGTIQGHVTDTLGYPINSVRVNYDFDLPDVYSDINGNFTISTYAKRTRLHFTHPNFLSNYLSAQIWPESTINVSIVLRRVVAVEEAGGFAPRSFNLWLNHPNPFNPSTTISYQIPQQEDVTLSVFDLQGREVVTIVDETRKGGMHTAVWNAADLPSGVYFCRFRSGTYSATIKMLLLR